MGGVIRPFFIYKKQPDGLKIQQAVTFIIKT